MDDRTIFQKIGDAVVDFAPGIATVLAATGVGAPIAAAVGAVGALGRSFGLGSSAKPEDVLTAISADPELRLKAMIAENDFKVEMGKQELEAMKAQLADVQSARTRQVESEKASGRRDYSLYVLAWTIIGGYFLLMGGLLYFSYQGRPISDQTGVLFMLFGTLSTSFGMVVGYFFGSSKGSADKSMELANIAAKKA
jgi:hypothetical protein